MKLSIFIVLCLLFSITLLAQDDSALPFRPSKSNFTVEVNFKPFSSEAPISIDGFRGRYFLSNHLAIRTGFNIDYKKRNEEIPENYSGMLYYSSLDEKSTVLGVTTGLEYHFTDFKRISPYVGVIIGYDNKTSNSEYKDVNYSFSGVTFDEYVISNAWRQTQVIQSSGGYYTVITDYYERGYSKLSANAVIGADIYVARHFYMGLELGLGYNTIFYKEINIELNGQDEEIYPKSTESNLGLNLNNSIRVGFWF